MTPLLSVIIPCYNAEKFLKDTVESVFSQTFVNYEIILIDDGSKDNTAEVIKSFGTKIKAEFGPNRGASAARNRGTELAQGEFIQYLDADDLLRVDALERKINALKQSGADVAYSDWQKLEENEEGKFYPGSVIQRRIENIHIDPEIALFTDFWAPPAALLYRRKIVDEIGGWNESLPIIQDARFLLDAALIGGKFIYVPGIGADYRVHRSNSLSQRNPLQFVKDVYYNACQVEAYWQNHGGLNSDRIQALKQVYNYTSRILFLGDKEMFRENIERLYQLEPEFRPTWPKIAEITSTLLPKYAVVMLLKLLGKSPIYL